jgi:CRP-like cAMP-binding protein
VKPQEVLVRLRLDKDGALVAQEESSKEPSKVNVPTREGLPSLFDNTTSETQNRIFDVLRTRQFDRGEVLFVAGDLVDRVYFVANGYVSLHVENEIGRDITVIVKTAGEMVQPESLSQQNYGCRGEAMASSTISYLPKSVFLDAMHDDPELALNVLRELSGALVKLEERVISYAGSWVVRRLAEMLFKLTLEGSPDPLGIRLPQGVTHDFLAGLVGSARETVTLQLAKLRKEGIVAQDGRAIIVTPRIKDYLAGARAGSGR